VFGVDDPRGDVVIVGSGWTYALTDNVQLDGGMNFGVTAASDHYNPFLGLSMRY
jgi:long-subunit fatty acid transport protein